MIKFCFFRQYRLPKGNKSAVYNHSNRDHLRSLVHVRAGDAHGFLLEQEGILPGPVYDSRHPRRHNVLRPTRINKERQRPDLDPQHGAVLSHFTLLQEHLLLAGFGEKLQGQCLPIPDPIVLTVDSSNTVLKPHLLHRAKVGRRQVENIPGKHTVIILVGCRYYDNSWIRGRSASLDSRPRYRWCRCSVWSDYPLPDELDYWQHISTVLQPGTDPAENPEQQTEPGPRSAL